MLLCWEGMVEGYTKNQAGKLLKQFSCISFEIQELVNEGYIVWDKISKTYKTIQEPRHLMSLYKTALKNRFQTLVQVGFAYQKNFEFLKSNEDTLDELFSKKKYINASSVEFRTLINQAPKEIKDILILILETPQEAVDLLGLNIKRRRGFNNNPLLCQVLGYNPSTTNLVKMFKEYFVS